MVSVDRLSLESVVERAKIEFEGLVGVAAELVEPAEFVPIGPDKRGLGGAEFVRCRVGQHRVFGALGN